MAASVNFDDLVEAHYRPLFRFAHSLVGDESGACDLTQQTFYLWAKKGHQLRDKSKAKSWLFTTLYREFLQLRRRHTAHPHVDMEIVETELPTIVPDFDRQLDARTLLNALTRLDEIFRAPMTLFHVDDLSYKEIAETLGVPIGTVMSRIARGREHLFRLLADRFSERPAKNIIRFDAGKQGKNDG
jgi:RNA polymerase sigma-70 factor (ECF subfamily)